MDDRSSISRTPPRLDPLYQSFLVEIAWDGVRHTPQTGSLVHSTIILFLVCINFVLKSMFDAAFARNTSLMTTVCPFALCHVANVERSSSLAIFLATLGDGARIILLARSLLKQSVVFFHW